MNNDLREELAALAHEQWSGWMKYLFEKGTHNDNGTWTMPDWAVERWTRQMETHYIDLSEEEKDSDREEADKFIKVFEDQMQRLGQSKVQIHIKDVVKGSSSACDEIEV